MHISERFSAVCVCFISCTSLSLSVFFSFFFPLLLSSTSVVSLLGGLDLASSVRVQRRPNHMQVAYCDN